MQVTPYARVRGCGGWCGNARIHYRLSFRMVRLWLAKFNNSRRGGYAFGWSTIKEKTPFGVIALKCCVLSYLQL